MFRTKDIIAATPGPVRTTCGIELIATHGYSDIGDGLDTLVVAGGAEAEQASDDPSLVECVRSMAPRVRRVASICTGAFILAAAGLLHMRVFRGPLSRPRLGGPVGKGLGVVSHCPCLPTMKRQARLP
jgi:transcriptional regulator GlxA family with amidase domain